MIRIVKPSGGPPELSRRGGQRIKEDCDSYIETGEDYRSGVKKFNFDSNIYGNSEVREQLLLAQHGKCCYCETKIRPAAHPNIEHYRPKGSVRQSKGCTKLYPGYYWLVYDWDNLLMCCPVCNTKKNDLFPLLDEDNRARSHEDPMECEQPMLVHPAIDDPNIHFHFSGSVIGHRTRQGKETIDCLDLNRDALRDKREGRLQQLCAFLCIVKMKDEMSNNGDFEDLVELANQEIRAAVSDQAEYSAFAKQLKEVRRTDWGTDDVAPVRPDSP